MTFSGGFSLYIKNKLKRFLSKNVFVPREILTKNLVTFKRWDGVKNEKF